MEPGLDAPSALASLVNALARTTLIAAVGVRTANTKIGAGIEICAACDSEWASFVLVCPRRPVRAQAAQDISMTYPYYMAGSFKVVGG